MPQTAKTQAPDIGFMSVPNPLREHTPDLKTVCGTITYAEDRITVARTFRDDPLARLHDRNQITGSQYHAGRHWQRLYEDSQVGRIGSSGDLKEPVDGTRMAREPITDRQIKATKRIIELDHVLGEEPAKLLRDVLVTGRTMEQVARKRGVDPTKGNVAFYGRSFRELCLTVLARELGYGG